MVNLTFIKQNASRGNLANKPKFKNEEIEKLTHLYMHNKYIDRIGDLRACKNLRVLYLHNNQITVIRNLNSLYILKHLYLQKNKITRIEGLDNLLELKKVYLGHNQIAVIEKLENQRKLEELHIEKQELPKGEELCFDPRTMNALENLIILNISCNNITTIYPLLPLRQLRVLKATHNNISDFNETAKILSCLYHLEDVDFTGNPMTKLHRYRETIIANTFRLEILDQKDINNTTREFIKRFEFEKAHQTESYNDLTEPDISGDIAPPIKKAISKTNVKSLHDSLSNTLLTTSMSEETMAYIPWNAMRKPSTTIPIKSISLKNFQKYPVSEEDKKITKKVQFTTILPELYSP